MTKIDKSDVAIVGSGLVGSLLAILLAKRGFKIDMFERRPDMRKENISAGRSINLAISTRGLTGLKRAGLYDDVLAQAVPMLGRMIHAKSGELTFQPYSRNPDEYINSVSRGALNKLLMIKAEASGAVQIHFQERAEGIDLATNSVKFLNEATNQEHEVTTGIVIGTDGAFSKVRETIMARPGYQFGSSRLDYGYKELAISELPGGGFRMEKNALHIWPRGNYMLIALPNYDGSYTCTLFLPFVGPVSFENLITKEAVTAFFKEEFPDAYDLMPDLVETFFANPTGHMDTVKCGPWFLEDKVLLLGDAAHAVVPFYGQGANCGFEDISVFEDCLDEFARTEPACYEHMVAEGGFFNLTSDERVKVTALFEKVSTLRKVNSDAIADMAVENFTEMRDKVGSSQFLLGKAVEKVLEREFSGQYYSRYSLVSFSNHPYKLALDAGIICEEIVGELCVNLENAEAVDLVKAKKLIAEKLTPLLIKYKLVPAQV